MKQVLFTLTTVICLIIVSCSQNPDAAADEKVTTSREKSETTPIFGIDGESIPLRKLPDAQAEKVINQKGTEALGTIQYCEVDYTVKVEILEKQKDWVKIKVVKPEWLSDSYIGWMPSRYLITEGDQEGQSIGPLNSSDYEILTTRHNNAVENYHVWLKKKDFDKNYVYQFAKQFKKEHCQRRCNVNIYDSKSIISLIGVYPLPDKDYLKMADHLVSISDFDSDLKDWYPFQDIRYKELGGKNWKKEPIK